MCYNHHCVPSYYIVYTHTFTHDSLCSNFPYHLKGLVLIQYTYLRIPICTCTCIEAKRFNYESYRVIEKSLLRGFISYYYTTHVEIV